jgi:hypothetical protein
MTLTPHVEQTPQSLSCRILQARPEIMRLHLVSNSEGFSFNEILKIP